MSHTAAEGVHWTALQHVVAAGQHVVADGQQRKENSLAEKIIFHQSGQSPARLGPAGCKFDDKGMFWTLARCLTAAAQLTYSLPAYQSQVGHLSPLACHCANSVAN
jgi:hypothetical protein